MSTRPMTIAAPSAGSFDRSAGVLYNGLFVLPNLWASGAVGSAREWHSRGHRFDPGLVHQTFIFGSDFPQVAEGRCGYAGSNKAISVERDSVRKEQLLEPLPLVE